MSALFDELRAMVGTKSPLGAARDPVNQPMIRHWCDAMEDHNPIYTDPDAATRSSHGEIVAPPTMLNAWTMLGNIPRTAAAGDPLSTSLRALDVAGYSSVVATNSDHHYDRYLRLGDQLQGTLELVDVSEEKHTALGSGHFVTTDTEYRNQVGERVGSMLFRILKFKPGTGRVAMPGGDELASLPPRMPRPRPGVIQETRFFWDGLEAGELRIQRCDGCETLHHPPLVRCPRCGSYEFGHRVASGRGHVYSVVEVHHPQVPAFDYPLCVALIELEEGTRLISNVIDVDPERVTVGMPVELALEAVEPGRTLPLFRMVRPERRSSTLHFGDVEVGQELAPCPIPITTTLIVAAAIASRDYQDVHHDRDLAKKRGSPDIFMNILSSGGLCGRYVTDWAGPEARMRNLCIRLGVPNYPGDCMVMSGTVKAKELREGRGVVQVELRGINRLGPHVTGTTELELPTGLAGPVGGGDGVVSMAFAGKTAIAGIGATDFSKESGRSTLRLAVEACDLAIADAGLAAADIDAIVTFTVDENHEIDVARSLGIPELTHFSRIHHSGGAACGTIHQAAMAVHSGACKNVLVYRAFNERSENRFGVGVQGRVPQPTPMAVDFGWSSPFGLLTPASWVAMFATRYMHEYGATSEDFGRCSVAFRKHAASNPAAFFHGKPITLEEHQQSRWIVKPLHLLDCCQESDGGQAVVVTSLERARDLARPPAVIASAAQGSAQDQHMMKSYYRDEITSIPEMGLCARQLWADTGLGPDDIDAAILYDHFTPLVLPQIEEFGFCKRGEARDFVKDGNIELGGRLPVNTNGGQIGEAYIHGMNGIAEGVRLVRGASVNQPDDVDHVLVTAGTAVPTSALILSRDR